MKKNTVGTLEQVGEGKVDEHRLALAPAVDACHHVAIGGLEQDAWCRRAVRLQDRKALGILGVARYKSIELRVGARQVGCGNRCQAGRRFGMEIAAWRYAQGFHGGGGAHDFVVVGQVLLVLTVVAIAHAQHGGKARLPRAVVTAFVQQTSILHHHGFAASVHHVHQRLRGGVGYAAVECVRNDDGLLSRLGAIVHPTHPGADGQRRQKHAALCGRLCPDADFGRIHGHGVGDQQGEAAIALTGVAAGHLVPGDGCQHTEHGDGGCQPLFPGQGLRHRLCAHGVAAGSALAHCLAMPRCARDRSTIASRMVHPVFS
ncbi:hypothetical protein D3C72_899360 [compost metagenome]